MKADLTAASQMWSGGNPRFAMSRGAQAYDNKQAPAMGMNYRAQPGIKPM